MKREYAGDVISNKLDIAITGAIMLITIITGAVASSLRVEAEDNDTTVTTASVTVAASCSMTATVESEHSANIPNGIYSGTELYPNGIGKTKIATFCNDNSGYAIYAIGFTGDSYDSEDHTKLIGATNGQKIATNTTTSGDISSWAMKLIKETDDTKSYNPTALTIENNYNNYNVIPNTYTKVANYTSTTDQTLGSVLSTTYAAYISPTQVADTYTGKVKYTLIHPSVVVPQDGPMSCTENMICYSPGANDVVGSMETQFCGSSGTVNLRASDYKRDGYGFAGWSDSYDYATNPNAHFYGPQQSFSPLRDMSNGLTMYAVWIPSAGSIQDTETVSSVCSDLVVAPTNGTANLSSVSAFTDERDNDTYAIAKLNGGKCWMIENLRLSEAVLDNSNTDNPVSSFTSLPTSTDPVQESWCSLSNEECVNSLRIYTGNKTRELQNGRYSFGNYYNWYTATTGNGVYNSAPSSVIVGSLCPIGWTLPTSVNDSGDYNALYDGNIKSIIGFPANFVMSGYVSNNSVKQLHQTGLYWSRTPGGSYYVNHLSFVRDHAIPTANLYSYYWTAGNRYNGFTMRCLFRG